MGAGGWGHGRAGGCKHSFKQRSSCLISALAGTVGTSGSRNLARIRPISDPDSHSTISRLDVRATGEGLDPLARQRAGRRCTRANPEHPVAQKRAMTDIAVRGTGPHRSGPQVSQRSSATGRLRPLRKIMVPLGTWAKIESWRGPVVGRISAQYLRGCRPNPPNRPPTPTHPRGLGVGVVSPEVLSQNPAQDRLSPTFSNAQLPLFLSNSHLA